MIQLHRLPAPARHLVASAYGLTLLRQRYGPDARERVAEILERDHWSPSRWKTWMENRLAWILHRAATQVPYYRELWGKRRQRGDRTSFEYLENWPVLAKEEIRRHAEAFLVEGFPPRRMLHDRTGGTTGTPLRVWLTRETNRTLYALYEARVRFWNGLTRREPWATLGGRLVAPADAARPPYWVHNWPMRHLYLSSGNIGAQTVRDYLCALTRHRATHLVAYTSAAACLAAHAHQAEVPAPPRLRLVVTNAEGLFPWQRAAIREGLGCPAIETYGMVELAACASERDGALRVWPEVGHVEVLNDGEDRPVGAGDSGRLICTGLLNAEMPLIRYDVGDRGRIGGPQPPLPYPVLEKVEGRQTEMLSTASGQRVWYFNPVFADLPVVEAQLIQEAPGTIRVLYVPALEFDAAGHHATIEERLAARLGPVAVRFEPMARVPREHNGKFRPVINRTVATDPSSAG